MYAPGIESQCVFVTQVDFACWCTGGDGGCLISHFVIGELLRGGAVFTLGGQGPLLFARVQREHLGRPPPAIRRQHISGCTESLCTNKLAFCQAARAHNEREEEPLRHVVTQGTTSVRSELFAHSCFTQFFF